LFGLLDVYVTRREKGIAEAAAPDRQEEETTMREPIRPTTLRDHVVLIGHGRVGGFISAVLKQRNVPMFVIEDDEDRVEELRQLGVEAVAGNAAVLEVIQAANLGAARCLLVAIPDAFEGGQVVQQARLINPTLLIVARAHSEEEIGHLKQHGADIVVMGEHEIAKSMLDNAVPTLPAGQAARAADASAPVLVEKPAVTS
jgi:CPA2 family monovalent cation:H+ antiporter-2